MKAGSRKGKKRQGSTKTGDEDALQSVMYEWEDKKEAKRAANRRSAHLSRKRKKMLLDDLKDENEGLRRKEQILRLVPDLVVAFDSSGCISFASHSAARFLDRTADELQDTSFWDMLSEDSENLVKGAFIDALAIERDDEDSDCTALWEGAPMHVELTDLNGEVRSFSMAAVVHFECEGPECVCSIRPKEQVGRRPHSKSRVSPSPIAGDADQEVDSKGTKVSSHRISAMP